MGGGGGKKQKKPTVEYAQPLDYAALMAQANEGAIEAMKAQVQAQINAYPEMERLQLGTIGKIANTLRRSPWTSGSRRDLSQARNMANRVAGIGQLLQSQAGPTSIEDTLRQQAEAELALGRQLSPEQERDAQQSARAAMSARGLGTSLGASAAEILNRDSYASAREAERRNFASATNQMVTGNVTGRYGQAASVLGNAGGMQQANAGLSMNLDPYQRALGYAGIGSTIGTNLSNQTGQTWSGAQQMAGNVASFNASMIDSRANTALNNWAAMNAARIGASAQQNAGMMGMFGSLGGGALAAGGMMGAAALAPAFMFSDKRMKKDIKPIGKAGSVLGLTAYEYKYKGDDEKRVGFMAQDVAKVLPEAVAEVDYKGKKRLAIKPAVIGQALAEELMTAKAA